MRFSNESPDPSSIQPGQSGQAPQPEEARTPRTLSPRQAVIGAMALFELNTRETELVELAERADLPYGPDDPEATDRLRCEWYGFVHAGLVWALMGRTTTEAVAGYLGTTAELLSRAADYTTDESDAFVDTTLTRYMRLFAENEQRRCPLELLARVVGEDFAETLSSDQIAFVAGMMAITLCNMLDTLDRYAFQDSGEESETASSDATGKE